MNPIKDIQDVLRNWDVFEEGRWPLYAFFLYTDEDRNLAAYVRDSFRSLDTLSGNDCLIFLIDEPEEKWLQQARKREYWSEFQFRTQIWEGFTQSRPYDKSQAYDIARHFGLSPAKLPCVVLFKSIHDRELLVYPLDPRWAHEDLSQAFRELFSVTQETENRLNSHSLDYEERRSRLKTEIWRDLKTYIRGKKTKRYLTHAFESPLVRTVGELITSIGGVV
jgi:hypothetical protein